MLSQEKMKNLIRAKSKATDLDPQELSQLFGLEQLLKKIAQSDYQDKLILKGGYLLSSIFGLTNRSTKDLDATIQKMPLTREKVEAFVNFLQSPDESGQVHFQNARIRESREAFQYQGFKIKLQFVNGKTRYPIDLDMTTGEVLLPLKEGQRVPMIFEEGYVTFTTYSVEQILADKIYTTLAYGQIDDTNSRSKDLYDIHFLSIQAPTADYKLINQAVESAKAQRGIEMSINDYLQIVDMLAASEKQREFWVKYQDLNKFSQGVSFETVMSSLGESVEKLINVKRQSNNKDEE